MFRDRTNLYLSYRRTIPRTEALKSSGFDNFGDDEQEGLIGRRKGAAPKSQYRDHEESIEMQPIAPSIFDISKQIDDNLQVIKSKTSELNGLYKKLLITSASDKPPLENKIETLNYEITKKFENCYVLIKKYEFLKNNHHRLNLNYSDNELTMIENFKKNYALKIQESSLIFRNLQNNYIKFLRDDDYDDLNDTSAFNTSSSNPLNRNTEASQDQGLLLQEEEETQKIENYSKQVIQESQMQMQTQQSTSDQFLQQRDREISKLAMGILEISTIFKEMDSLVVEQGTILDRIDYNITNTAQDLKESNKELLSAKTYQNRTTKCKLIFLLSLIVFALLIVVLVKPHGTTKYVEKPSSDSGAAPKKPVPQIGDGPSEGGSSDDTLVNDRPSLEKPDDNDNNLI